MAPQGGGTEIHRPGEMAKLADPRNVVASGCGRRGSLGLICPLPHSPPCRRAAPGAKRRRSAAVDPPPRNVVASPCGRRRFSRFDLPLGRTRRLAGEPRQDQATRKRGRRPGSAQHRCIGLPVPRFSRFNLPVPAAQRLAGEPRQGQATSKRGRSTIAKASRAHDPVADLDVHGASEASLALIARSEVADRRNATCHDGRA